MPPHTDLPRFEDLPIPVDVQPGRGWTEQMLEMADHFGPYDTLRFIEAFGGEILRISMEPGPDSRIALRLGFAFARRLGRIYGGNRLAVPCAHAAIRVAKRASILAQVREGTMTVADAARILRSSRNYVAYLVNQTDEAEGTDPPLRRRRDDRQIEMFSLD